jgi:hypothetical protein
MDTLNKFMVCTWETLFFMQLSKKMTRLPISRTSLTELGRSNVKKFHTKVYFIQHSGESSPHQPRVPQSCWLV